MAVWAGGGGPALRLPDRHAHGGTEHLAAGCAVGLVVVRPGIMAARTCGSHRTVGAPARRGFVQEPQGESAPPQVADIGF